MAARDLELPALERELLKESRILDRERRLTRECPDKLDDRRREGSRAGGGERRARRGCGPRARAVLPASTASPRGAVRQMGVRRPRRCRHGDRRVCQRRAADERVAETEPRRPKRCEQLFARAERGSDLERLRLVVVLEDRTSFGARQLHGVGHDRRQHLVRVQARADCLADLAQAFELVDGARELARSQVELCIRLLPGSRSHPGRRTSSRPRFREP